MSVLSLPSGAADVFCLSSVLFLATINLNGRTSPDIDKRAVRAGTT